MEYPWVALGDLNTGSETKYVSAEPKHDKNDISRKQKRSRLLLPSLEKRVRNKTVGEEERGSSHFCSEQERDRGHALQFQVPGWSLALLLGQGFRDGPLKAP